MRCSLGKKNRPPFPESPPEDPFKKDYCLGIYLGYGLEIFWGISNLSAHCFIRERGRSRPLNLKLARFVKNGGFVRGFSRG